MNKPKFSVGTKVVFCYEDTHKEGEILVVDVDGTFENPDVVSYDVMVEEEDMLYKHVTENLILAWRE